MTWYPSILVVPSYRFLRIPPHFVRMSFLSLWSSFRGEDLALHTSPLLESFVCMTGRLASNLFRSCALFVVGNVGWNYSLTGHSHGERFDIRLRSFLFSNPFLYDDSVLLFFFCLSHE